MPYWSLTQNQESFAIPKRKPPSQRPELKMDETALAIARQAEDARTAKAARPNRLMPANLSQKPELVINDSGRRRVGGIAPSPSTKRPKTFGS